MKTIPWLILICGTLIGAGCRTHHAAPRGGTVDVYSTDVQAAPQRSLRPEDVNLYPTTPTQPPLSPPLPPP